MMNQNQIKSELKKLEKVIGKKLSRPELAALIGLSSVTGAINKIVGKTPFTKRDLLVISQYVIAAEDQERFKKFFETEIIPAAKLLAEKRYAYIKKYRKKHK